MSGDLRERVRNNMFEIARGGWTGLVLNLCRPDVIALDMSESTFEGEGIDPAEIQPHVDEWLRGEGWYLRAQVVRGGIE